VAQLLAAQQVYP